MTQQLLQVNDRAPNFTLPDQNNKEHSLSDYKGKTVALYFYPNDGTPTCTRQSCNLRDNYKKLIDAGITIIGINAETTEKHNWFCKEYNLPFTLLSDPERKVATQYGTVTQFLFATFLLRVTYIINPDGIISNIITAVDASTHADQIIQAATKQ